LDIGIFDNNYYNTGIFKRKILYYLIPAVAGSALVTKVPSPPKLIKLVLD
jgi:hypothetical protein